MFGLAAKPKDAADKLHGDVKARMLTLSLTLALTLSLTLALTLTLTLALSLTLTPTLALALALALSRWATCWACGTLTRPVSVPTSCVGAVSSQRYRRPRTVVSTLGMP